MDAPTISIKINGLRAVDGLNGQLLGGIKIKGANAILGMGGREANRAMMGQNGLMMRMREMEDGRRMMQGPMQGPMQPMQSMQSMQPAMQPIQPPNGIAEIAKGSAATTKAAAGGAAKSAGLGGGAAYHSKGLAMSLWLGGFGPWLVLGSLGLAATGIYFYLRAQRMMLERGDEEYDDR
jgi:hypothetical protein